MAAGLSRNLLHLLNKGFQTLTIGDPSAVKGGVF